MQNEEEAIKKPFEKGIFFNGVRGEIRTLDRSLRRRLLYPTELREQIS